MECLTSSLLARGADIGSMKQQQFNNIGVVVAHGVLKRSRVCTKAGMRDRNRNKQAEEVRCMRDRNRNKQAEEVRCMRDRNRNKQAEEVGER